MKNLFRYWSGLKWEDKSFDEVDADLPKTFILGYKRKHPLTFYQLFFRDKLSIVGNFIPLLVLTLLLVIQLVVYVIK